MYLGTRTYQLYYQVYLGYFRNDQPGWPVGGINLNRLKEVES